MTEYDDLDWLYDVLYAAFDQKMLEEAFISQHAEFLDKAKIIHDASCGNGVQALALARRGYAISTSDISVKMIELAEEKARKENLSINAFVASWKQLPEMNKKYDLLFCCGNSISHSLTKGERIDNIKALSRCLNDNGVMVLDTRNWDKMKRSQYTIYEEREYKGKKYLPIYIWNISELNESSSVTIVFIESDGRKMQTYEKTLTFNPFSHEEIVKEVQEIGFSIIKDTYKMDEDEYCLHIKMLS